MSDLMEEVPDFIRCRNCSTYTPQDSTFGGWYCTKACAENYAVCQNCGKFFRVAVLKTETEDEESLTYKQEPQAGKEFCTLECSKDFLQEYQGKLDSRRNRLQSNGFPRNKNTSLFQTLVTKE